MVGPGFLVVDEAGLHETVGHTSTSVPWNGIGPVTETPEHVFVRITSMSGFVIPKSGSEENVRRLMEIMGRRCPHGVRHA